jgi:hypothetical protein
VLQVGEVFIYVVHDLNELELDAGLLRLRGARAGASGAAPGGSGRFRRPVFDVDANSPLNASEEQAAPEAILLFDGIFLHRPELRGY